MERQDLKMISKINFKGKNHFLLNLMIISWDNKQLKKGPDLHTILVVNLEDIYNGKEIPVN